MPHLPAWLLGRRRLGRRRLGRQAALRGYRQVATPPQPVQPRVALIFADGREVLLGGLQAQGLLDAAAVLQARDVPVGRPSPWESGQGS